MAHSARHIEETGQPEVGTGVIPEQAAQYGEVATTGSGRARRVGFLLAGIFVLSMADLAVTLAHLSSTGMAEANPVARLVIEHTQSSWGLAAYKLATVLTCIFLLYRLRHSIQSEIASWVCMLILVGLSLYWGHYTTHLHDPDTITVQMSGKIDDRWVTLVE